VEELSIGLFVLAIIMAVVAFAYSSVGLGGASSYTAIMVLAGMSTVVVPTVSLVMNLFVTTIGAFNFLRHRHGRFDLIAPFLVSSIPFSYLGGSLVLPRVVFYWLLLASLLIIAARIYLFSNLRIQLQLTRNGEITVSLILGAILGFVAGAVGIGGGVYLVPLIILFGLGSEKEAAACGAIFIWMNSLAGLAARLQYQSIDIVEYWPLLAATVVGGFIGSHSGAKIFAPETMQRILGVIILIAIGFLLRKLLFNM